jgi:hypothetical protein
MPTRRDALRLTGLGAAGLLLPWSTVEAALRAPIAGPALGLFFGSDALPALRERYLRDPLFAGLRERYAAIDRAAERRFLASEVRTNDQLYDIVRVGDLGQRMAFVHAMTGDEDAARLSIEAIRTLLRFPKWDYFLTGANEVFGLQRAPSSTYAIALAADWLGDALPDAERDTWLRAMGERGCEPCFRALHGMRHPDADTGWHMDPESTYFQHRPGDRGLDLSRWPHILDRTNLKAVPMSALVIGTLAYEQRFGADERTRRWMEQALYSMDTFAAMYTRDGSYDEGIAYGGYTSLHLAQATEALRRATGADRYDHFNWPGFVAFMRALHLPTVTDPRGIVNFGDAWSAPNSPVAFWAAARSRDPQAQWTGLNVAAGHDEWSLLWFDPAVPAEAPAPGPALWQNDLDWVVARTGYGADDLVVALRSGGPANHEHADRGSLIVKAFGERLVTDPNRPPYSFTDPAWIMRTTAGHSALLVDGQGHQYHDGREGTNASQAVARLIRTGERDGLMFWTSDATPAYAMVNDDVRSVTRTVLVLPALPAVVVLDKVIKARTASRITARYFAHNNDGKASVATNAGGFTIERPHAQMAALAGATAGVTVRAGHLPIPEETARLHPFVDVETAETRLDPLLVTVLVQRREGDLTEANVTAIGPHELAATIRRGDTRVRLRLFDTDAVPEFEVVAA